ncbi:MAG TPA: nucleoside 2-deoxyribosyltransferase [Ktedonobacterales bacterium]|nr:nucleoside 2-deoxyribosyltransferase [Ktedonobacterales bacterium]
MAQEKVYLAAPLFSLAEKRLNEELARNLEDNGFCVFLPQRDGMEFAEERSITPSRRAQLIYELDVQKVEEADIVIAVLDGRVPDEGVCVEIAIAAEQRRITGRQKLILGLKTDTRMLLDEAELNPMIMGCLDSLFRTFADVLVHIRKATV